MRTFFADAAPGSGGAGGATLQLVSRRVDRRVAAGPGPRYPGGHEELCRAAETVSLHCSEANLSSETGTEFVRHTGLRCNVVLD